MVRAEFGRLPLIMNAHARVWNYIKYLKKKSDKPLVQNSYELDVDPKNGDSLLRNCEYTYRDIIVKNIKNSYDSYKVGKYKVKLFMKADYVQFWEGKIRNSSMSASFAMHKMNYEYEPYLDQVTIKKHRNSLAKLRLSDHSLSIHTGRQTRPRTPPELRFCKKCPNLIEDEAHFLCECTDDSDLKTDFFKAIAISYPDVDNITDKQMKYKFIMKIKDPSSSKSLGFLVNLLFKNRDQ